MKLNDHVQNLGARVGTIQVVAFVLLALLGARLYYLQIVKGEYYMDRAENQRIRLIPIPAPRGAIFDRNGKLLVDSRPTYNVVLSNEPLKSINVNERVDDYSRGLGLERQFVVERLNLIKKQNEFEAMVLKENVGIQDIAWVESHLLEFPELRVELQPQRHYPLGMSLAHVLGYVGEISPKQLEDPEYKEKGFRPGDVIGKGGLEQYYDEFLRGRPGYRKVIVDSRGRVQAEVEKVEPQSGQDLISTIDYDLQLAAEEQLANSSTNAERSLRWTRIPAGSWRWRRLHHLTPTSLFREVRPPRAANRSPPIGRTKSVPYTIVRSRAAIRRDRRGRYPSRWVR